ncbi:MAG: chemotaxis protein CheW [Candidatus Omnitrophica bacterium]|nr:chemotaxis protein CheW [Candidatus Omnitrophota bacterium]
MNDIEMNGLDFHEDNDVLQLVCFKLAEEEYAIDINLIREVILVPKITPVPQMPAFCLGVINNRGSVIPVFDLRRKFYLQEKEFDGNTRILVAYIDHQIISMVVDEVLDNIKFESTLIDPAPSVKMKIEREYIQGLGEVENRMIIILDLAKMHEFIKQEIGIGQGFAQQEAI